MRAMPSRRRERISIAFTLGILTHSSRAFLPPTSCSQATFLASSQMCSSRLYQARGFGQPEDPPKPENTKKLRRKAKPLMPLANAASKLLPKEGKDGSVQFNNPAVGDFQVLDSLVKYPGKFELKIIGTSDDTFTSDIRRAVAGCLTKGDENVMECTTREKGKYTSITLNVYAHNSGELYKCYEVINEDPRVKFKF